MVFTTIRKPENTITWSKQEPVQTQYFTTQLSTLTYSTTGVMSSTTSGTFYTTAEATTISSNVSYSYQEGNIYSTSMTSTTIALPDGRTATSFGTMTTELKYSYYPNRRQTGEKYVAIDSNYVGNIYSTIASSTRSSCIIFDQKVNKTIDTFISSIYTPAYIIDTTSEIPIYPATFTRSRYIFGLADASIADFVSRETLSSRIGTSATTSTYTHTQSDAMFVSDYQPDDNGFRLNAMTASWGTSSTLYTSMGIVKRYLQGWIPSDSPRISFTFIAGTNIKIKDQTITTIVDMNLKFESFISTSASRSTISNYTSSYLYKTTISGYSNPVISFTYTKDSTTYSTVNTTSLTVPDFDGLVSAHNIADSMYYSIHYTYPFSESKTSYILHSDSITHQYYVSTTKEVRV